MEAADNGWKKYGERVITDMERIEECYKDLTKKVVTNEVNIAVLQVKAGMWGAIMGAIISTIGGVIILLLKK